MPLLSALTLKLILTPLLVGAASLAGRRWGPAVSGWLVGLPFTSGPVVVFLVLGNGLAFASAAAVGILAGTLSQVAFCLAYSWLAARWRWPGALVAGAGAFLAATAVLQQLVLPAVVWFALVLLALALGLRLMPRAAEESGQRVQPPRWDLPARMLVATAFVLALTGSAAALGPQLTGLLTPFPLYASILAVFAHQQQGPAAALRVLRGLLLGLFAFASFFLVLASLLVPAGATIAFGAALATALALQGVSLWSLRRRKALPSC